MLLENKPTILKAL